MQYAKLYELFDCEYYDRTHPDLRRHGITSDMQILSHFIQYGIREGRRFRLCNNLTFDTQFYLNTYPDLRTVGIATPKQALMHFFQFGAIEGRVCCARQMIDNYQGNLDKAIQDEYLQIPNNRGGSQDMINILVRTSGRPIHFEKCIQSNIAQKYGKYDVYVCYDKVESLDYLCKYKDDSRITYFPVYINSPEKYKFNMYCNLLIEKVTEGYIMFLDDDDYLLHNNVFTIINNALSKHRVVIWTFLRPDKLIAPQDITTNIVLGEIASPCVCFDATLVGNARWDDKQYLSLIHISEPTRPY